jgi:hypothetical protein
MLDIKSGTVNASNPIIIAHNRLWGGRPVDSVNCNGPSGLSTNDVVAVFHNYIENARVEGNIAEGAGYTFSQGYKNLTVASNLIANAQSHPIISGFAQRALSFLGNTVVGATITENVVTDFNESSAHYTLSIEDDFTLDPAIVISNNVFINSEDSYAEGNTFAGTISGNRYYNTLNPTWDPTPAADEVTVVGSGYDTEFCTTRKRITAPETWCLQNAVLDTNIAPPVGGAPVSPTNFQIVD